MNILLRQSVQTEPMQLYSDSCWYS